MTPAPHLIWFRSDLRTTDNAALFCASESQQPLIAIFFVCEKQWQQHDYGTAKVDFILRQLADLQQSLSKIHIPLLVVSVDYFADIPAQLAAIASQHKVAKVWCNHEYEVNEITRDTACQMALSQLNIKFEALHDQCIVPPNTVTTKEGGMYKVFTPFYKRWQEHLAYAPIDCLPAPTVSEAQASLAVANNDMSALKHYQLSDLPQHIHTDFPAGEATALQRLHDFVADDINHYKTHRDSPSLAATSTLSPYLSVGAISPRQCYVAAKWLLDEHPASTGAYCWISELCWRDFYRHIMVASPRIVRGQAFNHATDIRITWNKNQADFKKWCNGQTGIPLVDAAMRCLNATGYMHNRLRMVVAMFLTKNLLINWRWGERYFMQKLIDADFASNNGGWQWSASVGTDAAPYFRVMNPFSQAKTHDADALFIKTWLPELATLTPAVIHSPNKLAKVCAAVGYPKPMVDIKASRATAIEAFKV